MKFRTDVQNIPYKTSVVVLFKNKTIHSVVKEKSKWVRHNPDTGKKEYGFYDYYHVLGIDDDKDIEIQNQPIAWNFLEELVEN